MNYVKYAVMSAAILLIFMVSSVYAEKKEFTAVIGKDGVQRVEVLGGSYYFDPNYIIVKVNVPVEMKIRKEGFIPHDFVIHAPEAGMDVRVDLQGDPTVITVTPTKTGTYPFYCGKKLLFFSSHQEKGMEGTLDVRE